MKKTNAWPVYAAWSNMKARCTNPNHKVWEHYGGRGIKVCEQWMLFDNFFADMGDRPGPKHSLERINVNGDYEPGNCKWATWEEQQTNRRDTAFVTIEGAVYKRADLVKATGLKPETITDRAAKGLPFYEVTLVGRFYRKTATPEAIEARRKKASERTHCAKGHELTGYNLVARGVRKLCRTCLNTIARESAARRPTTRAGVVRNKSLP